MDNLFQFNGKRGPGFEPAGAVQEPGETVAQMAGGYACLRAILRSLRTPGAEIVLRLSTPLGESTAPAPVILGEGDLESAGAVLEHVRRGYLEANLPGAFSPPGPRE